MFRFDFPTEQEATEVSDFFNNNIKDGTPDIPTRIPEEKAEHQEWFDAMEIVPSQKIVDTLDYCELHSFDTVFGAGNPTRGTINIRHIVSGAMLNEIKGYAKSTAGSLSVSQYEKCDVMPGIYEGGAKIWECTKDLLDYLVDDFHCDWKNKRVLDLGCGSGLLGIFAQIQGAIVHYQDYNRDVLESITIPNVMLNMPRGQQEEEDEEDSDSESDEDDDEPETELKPPSNKKNKLTELVFDKKSNCNKKPKITEFESSTASDTLLEMLEDTEIKFYAGDWSKYAALTAEDEGFDVILSSETIYNPDNQTKLLDTFSKRLKRGGGKVLIAAKTHYFGVGGGTRQFELKIQEHGEFTSRVIWQGGHEDGVQREILELSWRS